GQTLAENFVSKWINDIKIRNAFLDELWTFLTEETSLLVNIPLMGQRNYVLANVFQLDCSKIGISTQWQYFTCTTCRRIHQRELMACSKYRCKGKLNKSEPSLENYNLSIINAPFNMLRPHEHTAQVPAKVREKVEIEFKKSKGRYNTLVATPTLELGVDIGALDMVLMRNVPPTPSNYWQRAGRAGRRHRLAVIYTYSRRSKHDQYFFDNPPSLLDGNIDTPKFNLKNEVMLQKHIHSTILSEFLKFQIGADETKTEQELREIEQALNVAFPNFIFDYLFNTEGEYRDNPPDLREFKRIVDKYKTFLLERLMKVFKHYWPTEDSNIISEEIVGNIISDMPKKLQEVINLLHLRMMWAVRTLQKYSDYKSRRLLKPEEEKVLIRCGMFIKELAQKHRDNYTLNVLANEGFLPGYGLYNGGIKAYAHQSFIGGGRNKPDFDLSRMPTMAVREFVPGNLIYANGGRFHIVVYRFPVSKQKIESGQFYVDVEKQYVKSNVNNAQETNYTTVNTNALTGISICDSDMQYISRINDEEVNRFQLPVVILGQLKTERRGGDVYSVNGNTIQTRFGQRILLLNVGPKETVKQQLGYPICSVCGAVRSPMSSDAELNHFYEFHKKRCGVVPSFYALTAEDKVDGILIQDLESNSIAVNLSESIIIAASQLLEMERNDLHSIVLPGQDDNYSAFIYDPMPGGSGLVNQIIDRWQEVVKTGIDILNDCPNSCESSCYACMRTYYNVYMHELLDRSEAIKSLNSYNDNLKYEYKLDAKESVEDIPPENRGANKGERSLVDILEHFGFPKFDSQRNIKIGPPYNNTQPDLYYEDIVQDIKVAVYFDGLSKK
ncbi:MAG: DUF1998 domain-containing protein, partial [Spirochaetaceae bacterium]|nr:DUF1998 domain-containing protein [Spirochaetaceae bacterium]